MVILRVFFEQLFRKGFGLLEVIGLQSSLHRPESPLAPRHIEGYEPGEEL